MRQLALMCGVAMLLAGCGANNTDRAVSGGGIGAGLGATIGLVAGGPLAGIVLGGAFGAATGLVTDEDTIDLGDPPWRKDD